MKQPGLFLFLAAGCAAVLTARTVQLTLAPRLEGRTIVIEGTTDLPDNAVIEWELRHEQLFQRHDVPVSRMASEGHAVVHDHHYRATLDLGGWPSGKIEVWVAFQPLSYGTRQPAHINWLYGRDGERIDGENVTIHPAHMRRVELIEHVSLGKTQKVRSAEAQTPGSLAAGAAKEAETQ